MFMHRTRVLVLGLAAIGLIAVAPMPACAEEWNQQIDELRRQVEELQRKDAEKQRRIDQLESERTRPATTPAPITQPPAPPSVAPAAVPSGQLPAAPATAVVPAPAPWSPEQPIRLFGTSQAYVNLSLDVLMDAGWSSTRDVTELEIGDHDPIQRGFTLPNAELVLEGAVDPYFRGFSNIILKLDEENETEVELEEAYLLTTSLPANLQVKAGQFLTEFGRHNQQHPHAWDFVDVPLVLGRILGAEGLRNPGARVSWLTPTPFYSELMLTVMDSQGGTAASFRDGENTHFGREPVETEVKDPGDLLYVPRVVASFDLTSSQTIVAGASAAFGPNASGEDTRTEIYGVDLYWKWKPEWQSAGWPFLSFQTEALYREYEVDEFTSTDEPPIVLPSEKLEDYGFYAQALYGFTRRWVAGLRGEYVTGGDGAFDEDPDRSDRFRGSPNISFYPTEFSKIRLQYNYDHGQLRGDDHSVWLQTEFLLGSHGAHKF